MTFEELLNTPDEKRDQVWEASFLQNLPRVGVQLLSNDPQTGPDGWPYLMGTTSDEAEPCERVLSWLSDKGIGLVINPQKTYPDMVISYGMAWSFKLRGSLYQPAPKSDEGSFEISPGQKIYTRHPDEAYLPQYARKILRQFFQEQGVPSVSVLLVSTDKKNEDLCISSDSLGNPPPEEHQGILEAVSWFLPSDYSIALIEEEGLPEFVPL